MSQESKKFEGKTLEEAYENASQTLGCSIVDLQIDIIQSPSKGIFGLFAKQAIIMACIKNKPHKKYHTKKYHKDKIHVDSIDKKLDNLDTNTQKDIKPNANIKQINKEKIFDDFYSTNDESNNTESKVIIKHNNQELIDKISKEINELFSHLCYDIDEIKIDIIEEDTVYIEFNGKDSALLIGKEGYRYKALSYILFNWINEKYNMNIKLEIASFLANQEEAIYNYLGPVIDVIKQDGYYKTKTLDGILVHIALKKLREEFPNKYVAIKTNPKGEKYIIVNEYRN